MVRDELKYMTTVFFHETINKWFRKSPMIPAYIMYCSNSTHPCRIDYEAQRDVIHYIFLLHSCYNHDRRHATFPLQPRCYNHITVVLLSYSTRSCYHFFTLVHVIIIHMWWDIFYKIIIKPFFPSRIVSQIFIINKFINSYLIMNFDAS